MTKSLRFTMLLLHGTVTVDLAWLFEYYYYRHYYWYCIYQIELQISVDSRGKSEVRFESTRRIDDEISGASVATDLSGLSSGERDERREDRENADRPMGAWLTSRNAERCTCLYLHAKNNRPAPDPPERDEDTLEDSPADGLREADHVMEIDVDRRDLLAGRPKSAWQPSRF